MFIPYIFFDVANTLLEKDNLYEVMFAIVNRFGFKGSLQEIRRIHSHTVEETIFPSKTDKVFYQTFNTHFLEKLGIQISDNLLHDFSSACRDLPWRGYPDTVCLEKIPFPKGIISNWDTTLPAKIDSLLPYSFFPIIGSASVGVSKPNTKIFHYALQAARVKPAQCWYIGDSLIQDIEPANNIGMKTILIDRYNIYPEYSGVCITSLSELPHVLSY